MASACAVKAGLRRFSAWLCAQGVALSLLLWFSPARAENHSVVVVAGSDGHAWQAAERRLVAELQTMGLRVVLVPPRGETMPELDDVARHYGTFAAVQVLRFGNNGVVRLWLGQHWHISVNLRNPEVVSLAVLPAAEFVFQRAFTIDVPATPKARAQPKPVRPEPTEPVPRPPKTLQPLQERWGRQQYPAAVDFPLRGARVYSGRLGTGPWFSGAESTPAVNLALGVKAHWLSWVGFELEGYVHLVPHTIDSLPGLGTLRMSGTRLHALLVPWPAANVSLGIGPGVGLMRLDLEVPRVSAVPLVSPLLSLRGELAAPMVPNVDVVFVVTGTHATRRFLSYSRLRPDARLLSVGVDAMLAVDWHWH